MRKLIIFAFLTITLFLTACSNVENNSNNQFDNTGTIDITPLTPLKWKDAEITDVVRVQGNREIPYALQSMFEEFSGDKDVVVIGEFLEDATSILSYQYIESLGEDVVFDRNSYNQMRIIEVLQGDIKPDEIITVVQRYAFDEKTGTLISHNEATPMNKGDRWIYFLGYHDGDDNPFKGTYAGMRYPVPNEEIMQFMEEAVSIMNERYEWLKSLEPELVSWNRTSYYNGILSSMVADTARRTFGENEKKYYEFDEKINIATDKIKTPLLGVLERCNFSFLLYAEILEYFQIESGDWINPGRHFDAGLISIVEKQLISTD